MLSTLFKSSTENGNVKQLVGHLLQKINFGMYRNFLYRVNRFPESAHKFVVFEYIESPYDSSIARSERIPGTTVSIETTLKHPDFDRSMKRLFGEVHWYTRRKLDFSKPFGPEQLTDIRQLVVVVEDEMPPLISANQTVLNPEEELHPLSWMHNQTVLNPHWGC